MTRDLTRTPLRALALTATAAAALALAGPVAGAQPAAPAPAAAPPVDGLGRPSEPVLGSIQDLANQPWVPEEGRQSLLKAIDFFRGGGEPGVGIPTDGGPISQFAWPTVMPNCIGGNQQAVGTAMAVPGPSPLPVPGVPAGQVAFVFTALGTGKVSPVQNQPMTVSWLNVSNGRSGLTPLGFNGINPDGPATVNGLADTGPGTVFMVLQGGVTTDVQGGVSNCNALPTMGSVVVR